MNQPFGAYVNFAMVPSNAWVFPVYIPSYPQVIYFSQNPSTSNFSEPKQSKQSENQAGNQCKKIKRIQQFVSRQVNPESQFLPSETNYKKNFKINKNKKQKKGRNILSNIFRSFLKFINSKQYFENEFQKLRQKMTREKFSEKLREQLGEFQNYVKKEQIFIFLKKTSRKDDNQQFNRIIRTSFMVYIKNFHVITIYNSRKIQPSFRRMHLKQLRRFGRSVEQLYQEVHKNSQVEQNFE